MPPSARLLVPGHRGQRGDCHAFLAAIPAVVDGGAHVVAVYRYCPATGDGPASATVLVHWGEDDALPEWGTHVMSHEADLGQHLLWQARYFHHFPAAWADLRERMPAWPVVARAPRRGRPVGCRIGTDDAGNPERRP